MTKELNVILDGQMTGRVVRDTRCRIFFTYEENWREAENAYPLSLSMPLALSGHGNDKIDPLLWGFDYVGPGLGGDLAAPFRPAEIYGLSSCPYRMRTRFHNGQPIESRRPLQFGRGTENA
jgi:hypothetical protein